MNKKRRLCLTRKKGQSIFLFLNNEDAENNIEIVIDRITNQFGSYQARLSIIADDSVKVLRDEIVRKYL